MGQTYSVILKMKVTDEAGAVKALQQKIADGEKDRTNFNVDHFRQIGIDTDTLEGLVRLFIGGWEGKVDTSRKGRFVRYDSGFDSCYGWEGVMMEMFDVLAPFLADNSYITIYPDSGVDHAKAVGGKAVWTS